MEGRCQCGTIRFTTPTPEPLKVYCCHCLECRHQSSSAFGMSAMFPAFELPKSEHISVFTRSTSRREGMNCHFCNKCGSRIMHSNSNGSKYVTVKAGCLEGLTKDMVAGACHIWIKRAVVDIPPNVERYEEEPPEEPGQEV